MVLYSFPGRFGWSIQLVCQSWELADAGDFGFLRGTRQCALLLPPDGLAAECRAAKTGGLGSGKPLSGPSLGKIWRDFDNLEIMGARRDTT